MKKRVIFFGKLPPPFIGPAVATKIILNSNLKNYFDIIHFDISHHTNINQLGKIRFKNFIHPLLLYFKLIYTILKYKPDMVYMPSQQTIIGYLRDVPFYVITKIFRVKLVCHLRGGYFLQWYNEECNYIMKKIISICQSFIDGQIVLGHNLIKLYSGLMPEDKIFVVPNGGDYFFNHKEKIKRNIIKILFLGNYIESKGILDFLRAATLLPRNYYGKIEIITSGYSRDESVDKKIKKLIKNNLDININDLGPTKGEEKFKVLSSADIFVFPTFYRNEGHPWVIVEALASGLPIISTDHGAIVESVVNNVNGFIVKKQDPYDIAEKIKILIDDSELRMKMGKESIKLHRKKFSEKCLVKNFKNAFDIVLDK